MNDQQYRRDALGDVMSQTDTHPGLWLDRYMPIYSDDEIKRNPANPAKRMRLQEQQPKKVLVGTVASLSAAGNGDLYKEFFFERWRESLAAVGAQMREGTVRTRMVLGLGSEGVLETSIALHRTYGVPYIPGSALKGLLAAYMREHYQQAAGYAALAEFLFGTTEGAGYLTVYDALYVPESGFDGSPLHADVMTVHHAEYYGKKEKPPADSDSPVPVPFLTATGRYLLALGMPDVDAAEQDAAQRWVGFAFGVLVRALDEWGIGAKTSSGYGRLTVPDEQPSAAAAGESAAEAQPSAAAAGESAAAVLARRLIDDIAALPNNKVANEISRFVQQWKQQALPESLRRQVAQAIVDKVKDAGREKKSSSKQWYQELVTYLEEGE